MADLPGDCIICRAASSDETADATLQRIQVWEDSLWRLTLSLAAEVLGFCYLEPKRHIPDISQLDGAEARTLGQVLARVTGVLREATGAELVYIYVFGDGVPHLHFHLAPHHPGDALNTQMIRGEVIVERLEDGAEQHLSQDFPLLPEAAQRAVAQTVKQRLAEPAL